MRQFIYIHVVLPTYLLHIIRNSHVTVTPIVSATVAASLVAVEFL